MLILPLQETRRRYYYFCQRSSVVFLFLHCPLARQVQECFLIFPFDNTTFIELKYRTSNWNSWTLAKKSLNCDPVFPRSVFVLVFPLSPPSLCVPSESSSRTVSFPFPSPSPPAKRRIRTPRKGEKKKRQLLFSHSAMRGKMNKKKPCVHTWGVRRKRKG